MGLGVLFVILISYELAILPVSEAKNVSFTLSGIFPAVFTPVDKHGNVNLDIIPFYAKFLKDKGMDGVLVAGTAGEGPTLTVCEKKKLIDAWVKAAAPLNLSVIAQVGGIPLPNAQELASFSEKVGVGAILTLPELYYKPKTVKELVYFLECVAQAAPNTALLYYHIPQYTDVNVNMIEFLKQATNKISNFKGIKSAVYGTSLQLQKMLVGNQKLFIADSDFDSFIMAEFNLCPELMKDIVRDGLSGNIRKTRALYYRLCKLKDVITDGGALGLPALKAAMPLLTGIEVGPIRNPEIQLTNAQLRSLKRRLSENGFISGTCGTR